MKTDHRVTETQSENDFSVTLCLCGPALGFGSLLMSDAASLPAPTRQTQLGSIAVSPISLIAIRSCSDPSAARVRSIGSS